MDLKEKLSKLIEEAMEAKREYSRLASNRDPKMVLGKPCTARQLDDLEKLVGKALPPSYRAFLELHNGWFHFDGDTHLLAVEDHKKKWVKDKVKELGELMEEYGDGNPFARGAIPIVLGADEGTFTLLDPRKVSKTGEMTLVTYDLTAEQDRFKDFVTFLKDDLAVTRILIEEES